MERNKRGKSVFRRVIGDCVIAAAVLLTIDVVVVMQHKINTVVLKDSYRSNFRYEMIMCAALLLLALDVRFGFWTKLKWKVAKAIGWLLRMAVIALSAIILYFSGRVICGMVINNAGPADYAIVLGMALENGQPTKDLLYRVETAKEYLEKNPGSTLILTGGNPDEKGRTEAAVMRDLLVERGASESRMILEDKAETTTDNFANAAKFVDPSKPIVLITSNYHVDRAVTTAKGAGFTNIMRLPAPAEISSFGSNLLWEVLQDVNMVIKSF